MPQSCEPRDRRAAGLKSWDTRGRGRVLHEHRCAHCGESFQAYLSERRKYCSLACSGAARQNGRPSHSPEAKRVAAKLIRQRRQGLAPRPLGPFRLKHCVCGEAFEAYHPYTRLRCDDCELDHQRARMRRRHSTAEDYARVATKRRKRRVHVRAGEPFDKLDIFERDGYVCQICGEPTDPTAHYHDNAYPSLDHVIPLARGGIHGPDNAQTAHRGCNSAKGARLPADAAAA